MKKIFKIWILVLIILLVTSLILSVWSSLLDSFRIVFGSVYVLFLPGYFLTYLFFPKNLNENERIDAIERIALSFALSIAVVPLIVFYLNLLGMKISVVNVFITILAIIIITLLLEIYKKDIIKIFKK